MTTFKYLSNDTKIFIIGQMIEKLSTKLKTLHTFLTDTLVHFIEQNIIWDNKLFSSNWKHPVHNIYLSFPSHLRLCILCPDPLFDTHKIMFRSLLFINKFTLEFSFTLIEFANPNQDGKILEWHQKCYTKESSRYI